MLYIPCYQLCFVELLFVFTVHIILHIFPFFLHFHSTQNTNKIKIANRFKNLYNTLVKCYYSIRSFCKNGENQKLSTFRYSKNKQARFFFGRKGQIIFWRNNFAISVDTFAQHFAFKIKTFSRILRFVGRGRTACLYFA